MKTDLTPLFSQSSPQAVAAPLLQRNDATASFGLTLTQTQAEDLVVRQRQVLESCGRLERGSGPLPLLIDAFCDSPYLLLEEYPETLSLLMEAFYHFKNVTLDAIPDEELVSLMRTLYDASGGYADYVAGASKEQLLNSFTRNQEPAEDE